MRSLVVVLICVVTVAAGCGGRVLQDREADPFESVDAGATAAAATPDSGTPSVTNPFHVGDDWVGTYTCRQGIMSLDLHILSMTDDSIDDALFQFTLENISGSYHVNGVFHPEDFTATFAPGAWVNDPASQGYSDSYAWYVGLAGTASGNAYSGMVTSTVCREFALTKR